MQIHGILSFSGASFLTSIISNRSFGLVPSRNMAGSDQEPTLTERRLVVMMTEFNNFMACGLSFGLYFITL